MNPVKSKFVVFEGIDGSGKSTQCLLLYDYISSLNIPAKLLAEPTNGKYGQKIRKMLQADKPLPVDEQIRLFIEDRKQDYKKNIAPCLKDNITIVMDRYFYSNAAYQGSKEIPPAEIIRRNLESGFPVPDRVYYIDIQPVIAMERIIARNGRGNTEMFEKISFLEKVRENFLAIQDNRFRKIDGNLAPEKIFRIVQKDFLSMFK
jgi:dTMP kinase